MKFRKLRKFIETPGIFDPVISTSLLFKSTRLRAASLRRLDETRKYGETSAEARAGTLELNFNLQLVKKLAGPASVRTDPPLAGGGTATIMQGGELSSVSLRHRGAASQLPPPGVVQGGEESCEHPGNSRTANSLARKSSLRAAPALGLR